MMTSSSEQSIPTVSVIIPCYRQAEFLPEAVSSALAQTYSAIEIVVVDDGSPDDVPSALAPFADRPNVRLHQQANTGVSIARNNGVAVSTGEYLQFLDADDLIEPDKIEMQMKEFSDHANAGVVYCDYSYVFIEHEMSFTVSLTADEFIHDDHFRSLWGRMMFPTCVPLVRRGWFDKLGGFSVDYPSGEDLDFVLRLAAAGCEMRIVSKPLAFYRKHSNSLTTMAGTTAWDDFERFLREAITRYPDRTFDATPIAFCKLNRQIQARSWFLTVARAELDAAKEQLRLHERALASQSDEYARLADLYKQHKLAAEEHVAGLERAFAESRRYAEALEKELQKVSGRPLNR